MDQVWACLRTFAPDHRFVVGPLADCPDYYLVAGLGGHGVTTASVVGRLAAASLLGEHEVPVEFDPERFGCRRSVRIDDPARRASE